MHAPRMNQKVIVFLAGLLLTAGCGRKEATAPDPATRETVWAAIQPLAQHHHLASTVIYALVAVESNFDPMARHGEARGLMQLKPEAWRTVSREPYEPNVWAWRQNLAVGVDYLAWCRSNLPQNQKFSYPVLLAVYLYGLDYVAARDFNLNKLDPPDSALGRELWRGNLTPLPPPK